MRTAHSLFIDAWKRLVRAYLIALFVGIVAGFLLVTVGNIQPDRLFAASSKRIAYALPVFETGIGYGIDMGVLIFLWNLFGALATLSFIHTASWFDPGRLEAFPRLLRRIFQGKGRMRLLCYLPGCTRFEAEPLRRVYVWVMVPLLGLGLLGIETGLQLSTAAFIHGAFLRAVIALLPHGIVEIPVFALSGAVAYSAHLLMDAQDQGTPVQRIFQQIDIHRQALSVGRIALGVVVGLMVAGIIEAHVTPTLMRMM